nr:protein FAR1-RELATED SEQUENCE 8-like [Lolium perenne]
MDEAWAQQNKDEEQPIMWLNKLPPGVKIPLTAEQMAKVAKMGLFKEIEDDDMSDDNNHTQIKLVDKHKASRQQSQQNKEDIKKEVYSDQARMKQHTGPSSSYGIPDKQNDRKTHMQPIPEKIIKEMKFATANNNSSDSTTSNTKETYEAYTCTETSGNKIIDHQESRGMGSTDEETSASKETNQKEAYSSSQNHSTGESNSPSEEQASKQETKEELKDDDPEINPDPPTKMEEEMDNMFSTDDYPAVEEIMSAAIPKEGARFKTRDDAFYRYALYARKEGFAVKKFSSKRSGKNGEMYMQMFACNKEGCTNTDAEPSSHRRTNVLLKTGCKALIIVRQFDGYWYIKKVHLEHNHPLEPTDYLIRFAHYHKRMTDLDRRLIHLLQMGRLPPRKMMLIFRSIRGKFRGIPFDVVDLSNIKSKQQQIEKDHDIQKCLERFKTLRKQALASIMTWKYTAKKEFAACFGWTQFGVNNHGSTVLFAVALLKDQTTETFIWVLETFVQAMGGKEPKTIIKDQDKAMKKAIQTVLKSTTHRNCYYHIVTKMNEFEMGWNKVIKDYNAGGEEHLSKLFRIRHRWVPAYFMDKFYPFSSSTGRSESTNNMWKCYSQHTDTITMFLEQYEVIQDKCLSALDKKKLTSTLKTAKLVTRHPFEKQALEQFTHEIFEKFQIEITNNTAFKVDGSLEPGRHLRLKRIVKFYNHMEFKRELFDVTFDDEKKNFMCSCKKMQRDGIHCCHVIKAMVHMEINDLPESFVIKRWRKDIDMELATLGNVADASCGDETLKFAGVMSHMAELCNKACPNDKAYNVMIQCMRDMETKVLAAIREDEGAKKLHDEETVATKHYVTHQCPTEEEQKEETE